MNYIGSKHRLLPFLTENICKIVNADLSKMVFCDLFAGTGIVGKTFKSSVKQLIANDCEYYSYVLNRNYIGNHILLDNASERIFQLNTLPLVEEGFIYKNFCIGGHGERQYFSDFNGQKIDTMRLKIEEWKQTASISEDMYFFLLCSLLESADKLANTASVYGSYLKKLKPMAQKQLVLEPAEFEYTATKHLVFQEDANTLINQIEGDILYLDPPYNLRQYSTNYHLLNTIAEYKTFIPKGKIGVGKRFKSKYCSLKKVRQAFESLFRDARFKYIFLSYNNEGLMTTQELQLMMKKYGHYDLIAKNYHRFKADNNENRQHKAAATVEFLHILEKR